MTSTTNSHFDKATEATTVAAAYPDAIKDRTLLITGVNKQGIGFTTAEAFASQAPRTLILAGRSSAKLQECVDALHATYPKVDIRPLIVDLSSQRSVRAAAAQLLSWKDVPAIHITVNNAGIMRHGETYDGPMPVSEDGIEEQFATNHLGHFLLTNLIMPKIIDATKDSTSGTVRIVNLSSSGTWVAPLRATDLKWEKPASALPQHEKPKFAMMTHAGMTVNEEMKYIPTAAYGQSKTCAVLFSTGLNKRLFDKYGVLSLSLNPGEIRTELGRNTADEWLNRMIKKREDMGIMEWKSQKEGASTTLVAATDPKLTLPREDGTGVFLHDSQIGKAPPWAVDQEDALKLWSISENLVGEKFVP